MKTAHVLNECAPLREEGERTLRLQACKDETFREALIADPKGLIQWLIPQCFPRGKMPKQRKINPLTASLYPHYRMSFWFLRFLKNKS